MARLIYIIFLFLTIMALMDVNEARRNRPSRQTPTPTPTPKSTPTPTPTPTPSARPPTTSSRPPSSTSTPSSPQSTPPTSTTFTGDATFFDPGLGACGRTNSASDFIFALPAVMFDPSPNGNPNRNPNCGRQATVTRNGKSVTVTCVDRCVGCKSGDIDLSPAAFNQIAIPDEGRVKVTWKFIS